MMTIEIGGYTVEIRAKYSPARDRMNQEDTKAVLNIISSWAFEAAESFRKLGCEHIGAQASKAANTIYDLLDSKGYFDEVKRREA